MNDKMKKFVIYARVSTEEQAAGDFSSIDVQIERCKYQLMASGHEVAWIAKDEGYSAKDLRRPALQSIRVTS